MATLPRRCAAALCLPCAAVAGGVAAGAGTLEVVTTEPRAFGYQVGDVLQRRITVDVPAGLALDETSLPRPGARGKALELRTVRRSSSWGPGARREELTLDYQVFLSPPAVRTLELPALTLRLAGLPRDRELRVDVWPVTVAPLVPVEVSPRLGLGELQPDVAPPLIETRAGRWRLAAYGVVLALLLIYLAAVYLGVPWWGARHRPFGLAWRQLRHLPAVPAAAQWRGACQQVHAALNQTAGEVLFERGVNHFASGQPAFAGLRGDIVRFLHLSRREFFAGQPHDAADVAWLLAFCRRCRDAERGT